LRDQQRAGLTGGDDINVILLQRPGSGA
jgi:hypothetical protein